MNKKKVYRLYKLMGLQKSKPLRKAIKSKVNRLNDVIKSEYPNQKWAVDFSFTKLSGGRMVKVLSIEDIYSRKSLLIHCANSIVGGDLEENMRNAFDKFGKPQVLISDNGPEFMSHILKIFLSKERIRHEYIEKGKPYLNGSIERFIGSLKTECLTPYAFDTLEEVRSAVKRYQKFYNRKRLHQSLDYRTPDEVFYSNPDKIGKNLISYGNQEIITKR